MIQNVVIRGFRSVRNVRMPLGRTTVVVGENGTGKSNLYRGLQLFQHAATGTLATAIANEGGMESILWAGDRKRQEPTRVHVEAEMDDFTYELELGLPPPDTSRTTVFDRDAEIKLERITIGGGVIAERHGLTATLRDTEGTPVTYAAEIWPGESVLSQIADPARFPAVPALRDRFAHWRFYHHFPTDENAPARQPMIPVRTPSLARDGHDLASALRTILEIGDHDTLDATIKDAFPGCRLVLDGSTVSMTTPGLRRPLGVKELSDGTLRYLCLVAGLLSPRPPSLLALNEPEASLHADLLGPLAELIAAVADTCQVWLTTHSTGLAKDIETAAGVEPIRLFREHGQTLIQGQGLLDRT